MLAIGLLLQLEEFGIVPIQREQFSMRAIFNHPAILHHQDAISQADRAEAIADKGRRLAFGQFAEAIASLRDL